MLRLLQRVLDAIWAMAREPDSDWEFYPGDRGLEMRRVVDGRAEFRPVTSAEREAFDDWDSMQF